MTSSDYVAKNGQHYTPVQMLACNGCDIKRNSEQCLELYVNAGCVNRADGVVVIWKEVLDAN